MGQTSSDLGDTFQTDNIDGASIQNQWSWYPPRPDGSRRRRRPRSSSSATYRWRDSGIANSWYAADYFDSDDDIELLTSELIRIAFVKQSHRRQAISAPAPGQRDGDENDDKVDEDENDDTLNDEIAAERFNAAALRFRRSNSLPSNLRQTSQLLQLTGREVQTRVTDSRDALDILLRSSAETPDGAGGQAIRRHLFAPASSGSMPPNVGRNIISRNSVRNMGADESTMTGPESDWSTDGEETYAMYQGFAGVRRRVSASSQSSYQSAIWRRSWGEGSTSFSFSNLRRKRADSRKSDVFDYDKFAMDHQAQRLTKPDDRSTTPTGATPDEELKSNHFVKNRANNAAAAAAHYSPSVVLRKTEKRAKRTRPSSTGDSMDYTRGGQAEFASTLRAASFGNGVNVAA
ncbi:uncharacterized protein LOC141910547 [Tubulanus polymorphus]|uniref:uncharacterized protein LOC141910547 n=1 Tax=Tubulanus polymorphus TaxID=672921 RepID=UPI003DA3AE5C